MKVIHFVIFIVGLFLVAQSFLTAGPTGINGGSYRNPKTLKPITRKVTKRKGAV